MASPKLTPEQVREVERRLDTRRKALLIADRNSPKRIAYEMNVSEQLVCRINCGKHTHQQFRSVRPNLRLVR